MPSTFDYAIVRVVPRVERGELINAGVIVSCPTEGFLAARIELAVDRLRALSPSTDTDEIAAALRIPQGAVRSRLSRADRHH